MMLRVRVVAVDDEKPARERLRHVLDHDPRVDLADCCQSGAEAVRTLLDAEAAGRPIQILFLDVQMPELDGFGVVSQLLERVGPDRLPVVVFVTAHDEYALRAFEAQAIDYLLKPYSDERFQATLDRALRHVHAGLAQTMLAQMRALLDGGTTAAVSQGSRSLAKKRAIDKILVKGLHRVRLLPVEQISWIEADGVYVKLHTRDGAEHLHRGLLGSLDEMLDDRRFVRIHRSAIVNIDVVAELRQDAHGDYVAVLRDQTEVRVGRHYRDRLRARLGQPL
jgi:two-component system, LytTR family, response regulator